MLKIQVLVFSFLFLIVGCAFAQSKNTYPYQGQIMDDEVQVYEKSNFDSNVLGTVQAEQVFDISKTTVNGFYKIRIKPGVTGYVSDADVKPLFKAGESLPPNENKIKNKKSKKSKNSAKGSGKKRSFEYTRFVGPQYAVIDYREETLGGKPHENLNSFGIKISGPNTLMEGLMPIDVNLIYYSGAPSYYSKSTGRSASGFMFLGDILFQTYWPQGKNVLTYFGFGPMMKYSKFDVELLDTTTSKYQPYSLEDISVGMSFDLGLALRIGTTAVRVDYQYFWEKQTYSGFTAAVQFPF